MRSRALLAALLLSACLGAPPHEHSGELGRVIASGRWVGASTPHVHLHALAGTPAAARAGELAERAEAARRTNLALLGEADASGILELVVLPGREHMRPHTGGTPGGWALPRDNAALVVADGSAGVPLLHETMHVLSWRLWGEPAGHWVSEGVAMLGTPVCAGYPVDELARAAAAEGSLLALDELPRRFDPAQASHVVQAASLVRFVRGRFGTVGVRGLWRDGLRGTPAALGTSRERLERDWLAGLEEAAPREVDWAATRRRGCEPA